MKAVDHRAVEEYYDSIANLEDRRLIDFPFEFENTVRYFQEFAPRPKSVLDLGCGTGRYASCFLGASVTLVDVSSRCLDFARKNLSEYSGAYTYIHADAFSACEAYRSLHDVVLCLGPLYHARSEEEVVDLLTTLVTSCLDRNGVIFASFISITAKLVDFILRDASDPAQLDRLYEHSCWANQSESALVHKIGAKGQDIMLANPETIKAWLLSRGIPVLFCGGIEGPASLLGLERNQLSEEQLSMNYALAKQLPCCTSNHIMVVIGGCNDRQ